MNVSVEPDNEGGYKSGFCHFCFETLKINGFVYLPNKN